MTISSYHGPEGGKDRTFTIAEELQSQSGLTLVSPLIPGGTQMSGKNLVPYPCDLFSANAYLALGHISIHPTLARFSWHVNLQLRSLLAPIFDAAMRCRALN